MQPRTLEKLRMMAPLGLDLKWWREAIASCMGPLMLMLISRWGFARLKAADAQRSLYTGVVIEQSTSGCPLTSYFTKSGMADMSPVSRV